MGKKKFIDKKKAVMFKLVPAIDKNNQRRVMIQYVDTKYCKLSEKEKQQLVKGLSNENEFDLKKVESVDPRFDGIPPQILERIRGRTDLVINQVRSGGKHGHHEEESDEEDIKIQQIEEEDEDEQYPQDQLQEDVKREGDLNEDDEWVDDNDEEDDVDSENCKVQDLNEQVIKPTKPPVFDETEFPSLKHPQMTEEQRRQAEQIKNLTEQQKRLLEGVLPQDYKLMEFKGIKMKKFDEMGLPLDDGRDYDKYFSKGGGEIIASIYSQKPPVTTPDVDYAESELPEQAKEVEDCLNEGEGYEELEDDFFIKLMHQQKVEIKKPVKKVAGSKKQMEVKKPKKLKASKQSQKIPQEVQQQKEPKQRPEELEDEEITDELLEQAIKDFDEHKQFNVKTKLEKPTAENEKPSSDQQDEFVPFHELSKKEKLRFMRQHKITEPEQVQRQELQQKLNSIQHCIKPEDVHLRKIYPKLKLEEDICMQSALTKQQDSPISESETESDNDDIVSYQMKHSTICSNLNIVQQARKQKKRDSNNQTIQQPSILRDMPKPVTDKRNRNQTKQEKKQRKERLKNFKKQRRQIKKEFLEQLNQQRKTQQGNTMAPLYGVSRIKIQ